MSWVIKSSVIWLPIKIGPVLWWHVTLGAVYPYAKEAQIQVNTNEDRCIVIMADMIKGSKEGSIRWSAYRWIRSNLPIYSSDPSHNPYTVHGNRLLRLRHTLTIHTWISSSVLLPIICYLLLSTNVDFSINKYHIDICHMWCWRSLSHMSDCDRYHGLMMLKSLYLTTWTAHNSSAHQGNNHRLTAHSDQHLIRNRNTTTI